MRSCAVKVEAGSASVSGVGVIALPLEPAVTVAGSRLIEIARSSTEVWVI
jgi:hypothetical protein